MNGAGLHFVSPRHFRGTVGKPVTFACQASDGHPKITGLTYGASSLTHEPFSVAVQPGTNPLSLGLTADQDGLLISVLEQYPGGHNLLAEVDYSKANSSVTLQIEGVS